MKPLEPINFLAAALLAAFGFLLLAGGGSAPVDMDRLPPFTDIPVAYRSGPTMELPLALRQQNWGTGSCVHASTVSLLRWQKLFDIADKWRQTYSGGEFSSRLIQRMEAAGLRYAYTTTGDEQFLEWCVQTRRGAGIFYKPQHAINLVGLDKDYAYLLDNNDTDRPERTGSYERVPRAEFLRRWQNEFSGFAWTVVYSPPAPLPISDDKT